MKAKPSFFFSLTASICFLFVSADMVIAQPAQDCSDDRWSACNSYQRPVPLMDYSPQEIGMYDTSYYELVESDCRVCHGENTSPRHHALGWTDCLECHDQNPPDPPVRDCTTIGCHHGDPDNAPNDDLGPLDGTGDGTNGWHHATDASAAANCTVCHDPNLIGAFGPGTSLIDDPPTVILPTPYSCENCHWQQEVVNQSGVPNNPGHPSTYYHYDIWGNLVGFYEYPRPIKLAATTAHKMYQSNLECVWCHSLTGTDSVTNPGDPSWDPDNLEQIRFCQRCHTKETLHAIHQQEFNSWEAAGFHTSDDPNDPNYGISDTYRLFTANDMCDGCHTPVTITQISPGQEEPTIYKGYEAAYLSTALGYTVTAPRWGRVRIYGNNFGLSRMSGDQVRIGDPRAGAPIELQYDTDSNYYTVETVLGGVSLYIGPWNQNNSNMIGVYLYPEPGQYLYALYGPNVGLHWLDTWLGLWVVKDNGGGPIASNVQPIKVLTPSPD